MLQQSEDGVAKKKAIDLREMAQLVISRWKIVAGTVVFFLFVALVELHITPSVYTVQMVVTQVQGQGEQASPRMNSLSSLAQLAGLNLGPSAGQSASQFRFYLDAIHSRDLADELAKNQQLMRTIFWREWDADTQSWRKPSPSVMEIIRGTIFWVLGARPEPWTPPDGARLQQFLSDPGNLDVVEDIRRPDHATIEVETTNPEYGRELLSDVNWNANELSRKRALRQATLYIDYLTKELSTVTVAEHREAIMQALSQQEQFKMSAGSGAPYAADVFDGPWTSLKRVSPRPAEAYPVAILKGLIVGSLLVVLLEYFGKAIRRRLRQWLPVEKLPPMVRQPLGL